MPTGFITRSKGRWQVAELWLGNVAMSGNPAVQNYSTAAGTAGLAIGTVGPQGSVNLINASSALSIWQLQGPFTPGVDVDLYLTVSSGAFVKAPAGGAFDPSTNTVFKSTYNMMVTLTPISSVSCRINGVFPPASTLVGGSGITLTTTT